MSDGPKSSSGVTRPWRGISAGDRRTERRQRLLDAGLELFGTRGVAATGIGDICEQARLTKRYFYESFASIDELAEAVFEQVTNRIAERVIPAIVAGGGSDPRPALTAWVEAVVDDPRVVRILVVEGRSGKLEPSGAGFANRAVDLWFTFAGEDMQRREDPALRLRAYAFAGAMAQIGLALHEGQLQLTADDVIDELVALFYRVSDSTAPRNAGATRGNRKK
jgi:AcrR family transcriptional regulator